MIYVDDGDFPRPFFVFLFFRFSLLAVALALVLKYNLLKLA